jgi:hypothetical protein
MYQWSVVTGEDSVAELVASPVAMYEVVREPGCPVMSLDVVPNAIETAIFESGIS